MEYQLEELLSVTAGLTEKYTSKESSSVTYETAQMLMEAVIYCISEYERDTNFALRAAKGLSAMEAYQIGYEKVVKTAKKAKAVYDRLTVDFEDYGCSNYRDTLISGMPKFFLNYDARFCPQDHILTLDYPSMSSCREENGIRLIYEYLCYMETEKHFLDCFDSQAVTALVRDVEEKREIYYMDNICSLVLLQSIGCLITKKQLSDLLLTRTDTEEIRRYFIDDTVEQIEDKLGAMIDLISYRAKHVHPKGMVNQAGFLGQQDYFQNQRKEFAVRIHNAIQYDVLDILFL